MKIKWRNNRSAGNGRIPTFHTLLHLSAPESPLRLLHTKLYNGHRKRIEGHQLLLYTAAGADTGIVLDNMEGYPRPLAQRAGLLPQHAFNRDTLWRMKGVHIGEPSTVDGLKPRQNMLARYEAAYTQSY